MPPTLTLRPPVPARPEERSYWIRTTVRGEPERSSPLREHIEAPIAIIGGGLTGLWTAWRILEQAPNQRVVLLEADFCGSGASGRNGGQVHSWFSSLPYLRAVVGKKEAVHLARETSNAIDELNELQAAGTFDMDLRLDGFIIGASSKAQEHAWKDFVRMAAEHGETPYRELDADELRARTGSSSAYQGILEQHAGTMNPYKLADSMRKRLIERGAIIHEGTPVLHIRSGNRVVLTTPYGSVTADKVLVATNAWAGSIPELNRYMYSVDGQVTTTEPIPDRLDALGWKAGEAIADGQTQVLYFQRTTDGRVLLGQGSGLPIYKDRLTTKNNRNAALVPPVVKELHRMYPSLKDVKLDYDWVGPIDITATHLPVLGTLRHHPNVYYCVGWSGTALAQIPVVARVLASRMLDRNDEWSTSRLFNQSRRTRIFPEPFRFIGATVVRQAVIRKVRLEMSNKKVDPITKLLISLMPRYRGPGKTAPD